jgi:hypothetical protein
MMSSSPQNARSDEKPSTRRRFASAFGLAWSADMLGNGAVGLDPDSLAGAHDDGRRGDAHLLGDSEALVAREKLVVH